MKRDDLLKSLLPDYFKPGCTWLDVGAGDGSVSLELNKLLKPSDFHCIDIAPGKRKPFHPTVHKFDGTGEGLSFFNGLRKNAEGKGGYDFVLFNFVLHHAAHRMWELLQAAATRTNCIVIQEDLDEEWPPGSFPSGKSVRERLHEHDPKAIYHSFMNWERLLRENLKLHNSAITSVRHSSEPMEDTYGYHVPRAIFLVNYEHAKAR